MRQANQQPGARGALISPGIVALTDGRLGFRHGALACDPDGHAVEFAEPVTSVPRGADLTCEQVIRLMADYLESALTREGIAEKRIWKDVSRASQPRPNAGDA